MSLSRCCHSSSAAALVLLLVLLATTVVVVVRAQAPVCDSTGGSSCGKHTLKVRNDGSRRNRREDEISEEDISEEEQPCALYLAESAVQPGRLGLFTGIRHSKGQAVSEPEPMIPLLDSNKNEWSPWHDMVLDGENFPTILKESRYLNDVFVPGVGGIAACSNVYNNFAPSDEELDRSIAPDSVGVHRSTHPTAGSFSYYEGFRYVATKNLLEGEELVLPCVDIDYDEDEHYSGGRKVLSLDFVKEVGICLDNLSVSKSTIDGAGRGAFSKRKFSTGDVISHSPVLHLDRSQMEIVQQEMYREDHFLPLRREHNIKYNATNVTGHQLLMNYAYGQPDSNVLLVPYAPVVNYINHAGPDRRKANAYIRWTNKDLESNLLSLPGVDAKAMKSMRPMELFSVPARGTHETLMVEFVAMRDIRPGEEILLYYGDRYQEAWSKHVEEWSAAESNRKEPSYKSAADYVAERGANEPIRTLDEQKNDPYPENIETSCFFVVGEEMDEEDVDTYVWDRSSSGHECLRPCQILSREEGGATGGDEFAYTVRVYAMERFEEPDACGDELPPEGVTVKGIPSSAVLLTDVPYVRIVLCPTFNLL